MSSAISLVKKQAYRAVGFLKCREIVLPFAVSRLVIIVLSVSLSLVPQIVSKVPHWVPPYLKLFAVWDGSWYVRIAEYGYHAHFDKFPDYVWFPLYPLLIRAFSSLTFDNYLVAAILLSNLCLALAMVFIYRYTDLLLGARLARRSIFYLSVFPLSFVFSFAYPASLMLLLTTAAFLFAEKDHWGLTGIAGMLSAATNPLGVTVLFPLLLLYLRKKSTPGSKKWRGRLDLKRLCRRFDLHVLWLALVPLGIIAYYAYLYFLTGNFWADVDGESHFGRSFGLFVHTIFNSVKLAVGSGSVLAWANLTFVSGYAILLVYMAASKKIRMEHLLLAALFVLIPLSTGQTDGIGRYGMAAFPFFWAMALLGERPVFHWAYLVLASALLLLLLFLVGTPLFVP